MVLLSGNIKSTTGFYKGHCRAFCFLLLYLKWVSVAVLKCLILWILFSHIVCAQQVRFVTENLPPFNYINADGEQDGVAVNIARELNLQLGTKTRIEFLPWARAMKIAYEQENVVIFSVLKTLERDEHFHWLMPITSINISAFGMSDAPYCCVKELKDITKETIGIIRSGAYVDYIRSFSNINSNKIVFGKSYEQLYSMLLLGRIDLYVGPLMLSHYMNYQLKLPAQQQPVLAFTLPLQFQNQLYFAMSKSSKEDVVTRYRGALQRIHQQGLVDKLYEQAEIKFSALNEKSLPSIE
jgi:polar amino acid transport system substrate-binding protein